MLKILGQPLQLAFGELYPTGLIIAYPTLTGTMLSISSHRQKLCSGEPRV
jgi:hypothetical protein